MSAHATGDFITRSCDGISPPGAGHDTVSSKEVVVHVCMVTPHMPPEQAANALLPSVLAREFARAGHRTTFLTHPAQGSPRSTFGSTVYVRRRGRGPLASSHPGAMSTAARIGVAAARAFRGADLVHLHSNGFIVDVAGWMAARLALPAVVTLYGTDIWHFDPARHRRFAGVVRGAAQRVFYSRALRHRAVELGLATPDAPVIYAPVDEMFQAPADAEREALRRMLGVSGPMLLTVKRLHPVAGYEDLLKAFAILANECRTPACSSPAAESSDRIRAPSRGSWPRASRPLSRARREPGPSQVLRRRGPVRPAFTAGVVGNGDARGAGLRHAGRRHSDRRGSGSS